MPRKTETVCKTCQYVLTYDVTLSEPVGLGLIRVSIGPLLAVEFEETPGSAVGVDIQATINRRLRKICVKILKDPGQNNWDINIEYDSAENTSCGICGDSGAVALALPDGINHICLTCDYARRRHCNLEWPEWLAMRRRHVQHQNSPEALASRGKLNNEIMVRQTELDDNASFKTLWYTPTTGGYRITQYQRETEVLVDLPHPDDAFLEAIACLHEPIEDPDPPAAG